MLTSDLPITERATSVLYHYTSPQAALDILKSGVFQLSSVVGNASEESYAPAGHPYFLSTTRSRTGDYHRYTGNSAVMLVLDGDWFNRHYKVRPIDYWERAWNHPQSGRSRESEDRVFSREATIPAQGLRSVHVLLKTQDDTRSADVRRLLIAAKQQALPAWLYQDEQAWRAQDTRRSLPMDQAMGLLRGQERSRWGGRRRNYLEQWVELIHKQKTSDLSDQAQRLAFNLVYYNRGRSDDDMNLGVDLANARKPSDSDRDTAIRLISHLKKYDLDTRRMVKDLHDKWAEIKQQEAAAKKESISEDKELTEVEMSPGAFRRFLNSPEAEGIRAGFEAELIFRNTKSDENDGEPEPDYDMDERTGSIDDIISFFQGGDDGIGPGQARRLRDSLAEEFSDWVRESFYDNYFDQDRFREWCDDNIWPKVDDDYREDARKYLEDVEDNSEPDDDAIEKTAVRLFHDDVERNWDDQGEWWDEAQEELYDEYAGEADEDDWLDSQGYRYMSDVANSFDLGWPYWTYSDTGLGERDWAEIGNSLERVTGMPVRVSGGYHGAARREGQYIIEPDSSLDADDKEDFGLEVVSPPMPLPEAIEQLNRIIDWANSDGDAYTNSSTGIHMGVSLPFKGGDVDPIKLVLFMGDKNILETFGRESNHYARSAYDRIQDKIRYMKNAGPKQIEGVMELMKKNLIELADRQLQRGGLGDKYVSVHPQDGYIEFRGPGGDYLSKNDEVEGVLENTMLRLAYAMSIAGRPDLYRKEYAKKLYKVLTGYRGAEISKGSKDTKYRTKIESEGENPFMRLFADYSAGAITGDELKRQWADTVLRMEQGEEEDEDVPMDIAKEYEVYDRDTGEVYQTFTAYNDDEALLRFRAQYRDRYAQPGRLPVLRRKKAAEKPKAVPSRRAELAKRVTRSTRDVGEQLWRVNRHSSFQFVTARSQAEAVSKAVEKDRAFDDPATRARIATDAERQQYQMDQERERQRAVQAQAGEPRPAGGEFTGTWIIRDGNGRELHRFSGIGNNQADANRFAAGWLGRNRPQLAGQEIEVTPEMR